MIKCNKLWNAVKRPKSAEVIQDVLRYTFDRSGSTKWSIMFSLKRINEMHGKITHYVVSESAFVRQWISLDKKCLKRISEALNIIHFALTIKKAGKIDEKKFFSAKY